MLNVKEIRDKVVATEQQLATHGGQADVEKVLGKLREVIPSLEEHARNFNPGDVVNLEQGTFHLPEL